MHQPHESDQILRIIRSLKTTDEAEHFLDEVAIVSDALFRVGEHDINHIFATQIRSKSLTILQKLFLDMQISLTDRDAVTQVLNQLKDTLAKCPVLEVNIAFEPTDETITMIQTFLVNAEVPNALLSLHTSFDLIAGCTLTYAGKYRDYSLKDTFAQKIKSVSETLQS